MKKILVIGLSILLVYFLANIKQKINTNQNTTSIGDTTSVLVKSPRILNEFVEGSPFVWKEKLYYLASERTIDGKEHKLAIYDFNLNIRLASTGDGLGLASVLVENDIIHIFATRKWGEKGESEIVLIQSKDLKNFSSPKPVLKSLSNESYFNTSITKNIYNEYIMAVETDQSGLPAFNIRFFKSSDMLNWINHSNEIFGTEVYVACPSLRYIDGYYYMLYLRDRVIDHECDNCVHYITQIARSKDLLVWEFSTKDVLYPQANEGINTSDPDLVEYNSTTYLIYSVGDQATWSKMKYAVFGGSLRSFFNTYFQ